MIDYDNLATAVMYYKTKGFQYIEVPWLVSTAVSDMTRPEEALQYEVVKGSKVKAFIASGEQGFLYMIAKGYMERGTFQTITPCIRNEDFDDYHTKYFMKNELIEINPEFPYVSMFKMIESARKLFEALIDGSVDIKPTGKCGEAYDLEYKGIELGSYGVRKNNLCEWVYGTGLAEPRFSKVRNNAKVQQVKE